VHHALRLWRLDGTEETLGGHRSMHTSHPHPRADPIGWGGRGGVGGEYRQFHRSRPSPCQRSALAAESRRRKKVISHPPDEGLGHSRGGLTTKFHLACDDRVRPLSIVITPGHRHDSTQLQAVLNGIRVPRAADASDRGPARITSSPTRATVIRAVVAGCASGCSRPSCGRSCHQLRSCGSLAAR
jgi:hypothetical protein